MKIFLDLSTKTVQIIDAIGFDELDELKKFLGPDYMNWKIEPTATHDSGEIQNPITQPFQQPYNPLGPYYNSPNPLYNPIQPTIVYGSGSTAGSGNSIGLTTNSIGVSTIGSGANSITTGTAVGYSYTPTGCFTGTEARWSNNELSVFCSQNDDNKILVIGDISSSTLTDIYKNKINKSNN